MMRRQNETCRLGLGIAIILLPHVSGLWFTGGESPLEIVESLDRILISLFS